MFDLYEPLSPLRCPHCAEIIQGHRWQGKSGPNLLLVWREGRLSPVDEQCDEDLRMSADDRNSFRLPEIFDIYSECPCGQHLRATGFCTNGAWDLTVMGDQQARQTIPADLVGDGFRQCTACAHAWFEPAPIATCPGCKRITLLND